jgi:hypothetical protein
LLNQNTYVNSGSWLNFVNENHENDFFGHSEVENFQEAKIRELEIFPIYSVAAIFRITISVCIWFFREQRVKKLAQECMGPEFNFANPVEHLRGDYMKGFKS